METWKQVRFRRIILAVTVLVSLFILMAGLALAWYVRNASISQTPTLVSAYADVAASISGAPEYVAVVWSEGSANHIGALKLRWGPPGQTWRWPVTIIEDYSSQSREPAIAVYSDTAYIAYIKQPQGTDNWVVGYAECKYGSACIKETVSSDTTSKGSADIALCGSPMVPHVVWATVPSDNKIIWYSSRQGNNSWSGPTEVSQGTNNSSPSIACVGNTVSFAWIQNDQYVRYDKDSNPIWPGGTSNTPFNTSMAAYGDYVDVVWDTRDSSDGSNEYHLYLWRKHLDGSACWGRIPNATTYYTSTVPGDGGSEYVFYLRPSNAVYSDTAYAHPVPVVVWHAQVDGVYQVMYSHGIGFPTDCEVTWSEPETLTLDFCTADCSLPSIAVGISDTVTHTHVVFQQRLPAPAPTPNPWEIYYLNDFGGPLIGGEPPHNDVYLPVIMKNY